MAKGTNGITVELIAETYKKKGCNVSATCVALNMTRYTFYKWKEKSKKLNDLLKEADESVLDFAESKLMEHISKDDVTSLIFFLKTKGKKRGYVERTEQDVTINPFEELMKTVSDK